MIRAGLERERQRPVRRQRRVVRVVGVGIRHQRPAGAAAEHDRSCADVVARPDHAVGDQVVAAADVRPELEAADGGGNRDDGVRQRLGRSQQLGCLRIRRDDRDRPEVALPFVLRRDVDAAVGEDTGEDAVLARRQVDGIGTPLEPRPPCHVYRRAEVEIARRQRPHAAVVVPLASARSRRPPLDRPEQRRGRVLRVEYVVVCLVHDVVPPRLDVDVVHNPLFEQEEVLAGLDDDHAVGSDRDERRPDRFLGECRGEEVPAVLEPDADLAEHGLARRGGLAVAVAVVDARLGVDVVGETVAVEVERDDASIRALDRVRAHSEVSARRKLDLGAHLLAFAASEEEVAPGEELRSAGAGSGPELRHARHRRRGRAKRGDLVLGGA